MTAATRPLPSLLHRALCRVLLLCCLGYSPAMSAQQSVAYLGVGDRGPSAKAVVSDGFFARNFTFERNLIFFDATLDGQAGRYILDTGAPGLIVNLRHQPQATAAAVRGIGTGGTLTLSDHRVRQLRIGDRTVTDYWAVGSDLRDFETRTGQRIDGFLGYDLLSDGELRIDYTRKQFQLLKSRRKPTHTGLPPSRIIKFFFLDHLPVIEIRIDGRNYYFALDTGAGVNLIDCKHLPQRLLDSTGSTVNVQGLDGRPTDGEALKLSGNDLLYGQSFVSTDLEPLSEGSDLRISGILGSPFLSQYTVGIDYRRRRVYLW